MAIWTEYFEILYFVLYLNFIDSLDVTNEWTCPTAILPSQTRQESNQGSDIFIS